ncbi:PH domain-containing protein [Gottfriedia acidiceleris]|uniref:PH domain-containing protein n=1 Tax=Gottfriedia acidiceleris TaxID=371036 RepID=UPI00101C53AD|nr:PH domain-containing protein [Gottfriedia acidiceleris]
MRVYQKICYAVEDIFVKFLTMNSDKEKALKNVQTYRNKIAEEKSRKKQEHIKHIQERQRAADEMKEQEKQRIQSVLSRMVDVKNLDYTQYEYNEVKRNEAFFKWVYNNIFETGEQGLTFINCEFDKSKKKEIKGFLIATNKRVWFIDNSQTMVRKFRYQTIKDVSWFKDGMLEKGLYLQYGVKRLEFDEIFDTNQMKRIGNTILQIAQTA